METENNKNESDISWDDLENIIQEEIINGNITSDVLIKFFKNYNTLKHLLSLYKDQNNHRQTLIEKYSNLVDKNMKECNQLYGQLFKEKRKALRWQFISFALGMILISLGIIFL